MSLILPFQFINKVPGDEAQLATVVFVENCYAAKPEKDSNGKQENGSFFYTAWQYLNPSGGSEENFQYDTQLAVSARIASQQDTLAPDSDGAGQNSTLVTPRNYLPSPLQQVFAGQRWQVEEVSVTRSGKTIQSLRVKAAGAAKGPFVEVINNIELEPGYTMELDWFFGPSQMGVTCGLTQGQPAVLQTGTRIFFKPVMPGADKWVQKRWTPGELEDATVYVPPITAEMIQVFFQKKQGPEPPAELKKHNDRPPETPGSPSLPEERQYLFIPIE
ncbi:MAG: hypothetical protein KKC20_11730 [Proteobacteria bacterium]|nr:hypothetical protein [Pseudomonadota bacterium]